MKTKFLLRLLTVSALVCFLQAQAINAVVPAPPALTPAEARELIIQNNERNATDCTRNANDAFMGCVRSCTTPTCVQEKLGDFHKKALKSHCGESADVARGCYTNHQSSLISALNKCPNERTDCSSTYSSCAGALVSALTKCAEQGE